MVSVLGNEADFHSLNDLADLKGAPLWFTFLFINVKKNVLC